MLVRVTCSVKYCRAKKATEKLKIHAKYNILRNKKTLPAFFRKILNISIKSLGSYSLYCQNGKKS